MSTNFGWESELPALASLSDADAAAAIAGMTVVVNRPVELSALIDYATNQGFLGNLLGASDPYSKAVQWRMTNSNAGPIDFSSPGAQAMAAGLVAAGVLTSAQAAGCAALGQSSVPKYPQGCWTGQVKTARAQA